MSTTHYNKLVRRKPVHHRRSPSRRRRDLSEGAGVLHAALHPGPDRHAGKGRRPGHPRNLQEHSAPPGHPDRRGDRRAGAGALHSHPHQHRPDQGALQQRAVGKAVKQMDVNGNTIEIFPSKRSAAERTGINARSISDAIAGVQKTAGGYKWACADINNDDG